MTDNTERCPECSREKARSVEDVLVGKCPKWWGIRDQAAEDDCVFYAKKSRNEYLTEKVLGECWHEPPIPVWEWRCKKCGSNDVSDLNRPYNNPRDSYDLVEQLKRLGKWGEFLCYLRYGQEIDLFDFGDILTTPDLLADKVYEWWKETHK